jgi:Na+-transporting methylmalonyl-CoA/oxaloacetate decarboxylase gamma subunit
MEQAIIQGLTRVLIEMGPGGIVALVLVPGLGMVMMVLVLWYLQWRQMSRLHEQYRQDMQVALEQYKKHQQELGDMYMNNVKLVEEQQKVVNALQTTVVRNTEAFASLREAILTNQYCPYVRLEKEAKGPVK